jgi:hypothetical protein
MKEKELAIKRLKNELEQYEKQYNDLSSFEIPFLMSEIGLQSFTLSDGTHFVVKPILQISLPVSDQLRVEIADRWLTDHGHGGMVKTNIDVSLPKASQRLPEIEQALSNLGVEYSIKKAIHPMTLKGWGNEMERNGMVIPEDIFSVFRTHKTYIE